MKIETWIYESIVMLLFLSLITWWFNNNLVNWITVAALMFTFQYTQIADRLQERQVLLQSPTVKCYKKLNVFYCLKEVLWIAAFIIMRNYAAIAGSICFFIYPYWRKFYRAKIKPLA